MKRQIIAAMLLVFVAAGSAFSQAQQPAAPGEVVLMIAPVRAIGDDGKSAWISQAVQQNLLNDLSRLQSVRPILPKEPVADLESAIKAAKAQNATHVFEGSFQLGDPGSRITGQILDLRTNQYVGAAKATGALRELFALEDSISEQVRRIALAQVKVEVRPLPAPAVNANDVAIQPEGPVQIRRQFPWDRDKPFLEEARRQAIIDRDYEDSRYRTTYTYGSSYYGYGGYYSRPWYGYGGVTFFPGGVIRGRAVFFPGGVINVGRW